MTQEEKLQEAKRLYKTANSDQRYVLESLFPELKESEDERIRKDVYNYLYNERHNIRQLTPYTDELDRWLAWLEKQKPINISIEDKRIRKSLINYVKAHGNGGDFTKEKYIAWLEKQAEQKHTAEEVLIKAGLKPYKDGDQWCVLLGDNIQEGICGFGNTIEDALYAFLKDLIASQGEQKPANKVEPRFKVGDWVVYNRDDCSREIIQVYDIRDGRYYFTDNVHFSWSIKECDEKSHLWTIQDAKDGDVLVYKDEISLYKHDINNCTNQETTFGGFVFHCCYDGKRFIMDSLYSLTEQDKMDIQPATKEQRDLLFAKMNEAGYEWDAEKKELSRRVIDEGKAEMDYCFTKMMNGEKVSPIWSEDDERILEEVKFNFESNKEQMTPALMECYEKFFNKIKHLIPQNDKQELSGEDETAIDVLINLVKMPYGNYIDFSAKNRLLNWLIALKGRITQYLLVNYG